MLISPRRRPIGDPTRPAPTVRWALLAFVLACAASLAAAQAAGAARTVYFADPAADAIAQFAVGPGGALTPLEPRSVAADRPLRLAMTPDGDDLYATADDGILQYDVATDGRLTPKSPALRPAHGIPFSIAIHPDGASAYVTDLLRDRVLQYDIAGDGRLEPKDPAAVPAGDFPTGIAVRPNGRTAYALVRGGMAVFDVDAGGALARRPGLVDVPASGLVDLALTPDGRHLYATSLHGAVLQFDVGDDGSPVAKSPPELDLGPGARPVGIAVVPDGSAVYVSSRGSADEGGRGVFAFAVGPGGGLTPGATPLAASRSKLWFLSASPDGKSLFVAGGDGHLFDLGAGASLAPKASPSVSLRGAFGVVVSPNQAPVAGFTAIPGTAGASTLFDASSAVDPDGSIVRYDWNFGDGTVLLDGGPTPSHVYTTPGDYTVSLVVTDNEGASTTTVFTGGTVLGHGRPVAQASLQIRVAAPTAAPAPPPPPAVAPTQALQPDLGESFLAEPLSGRIRVRLPGAPNFQPLADLRELPMGSTIDARRGRVELTTVRDRRRNRLQEGRFHGGVFKVRQRARDRFITELVLNERLAPCPSRRAAGASRAARRRLWGDGRGRFRSRGRYSSAAVRGTRWLVEDSCKGTLTRVSRGVVAVRDFVRDRTIVLRRGERYLARPR